MNKRTVALRDKTLDTVQYVEYVPVIGQHPDYEAALHALKAMP